ncbi:MAG: hypothetical protein KBS60_00505, partial [Phascolarctobacterium sp.]|nr:hypothetical protein [Candidatus Phascolarctobacterium caballi]
MLNKAKEFVKRDLVLLIAIILAAVSSIFHKPDLNYVDVDVLLVLFSLMLVVALLKSIFFLDWLASKLLCHCTTFREVTNVLACLTFVVSMFVTNDVALITFVPLALIIGRTIQLDMIRPVILMTMAANLGSMLTPQGNPQNLFLFNHFHYTPQGFLSIMSIPVLFSAVYILLLIWRTKNVKVNFQLENMHELNKKMTILALFLLALNIAAVLHYLEKLPVIGVTLLAIIFVNWRLLMKADYGLLLTFVGFFLFIGNIQQTDLVVYLKNSFLGTAWGTYMVALGVSQFISNVPAAMLLAGLTDQANALLIGVNVGGLGTLIASMASVISYKFFVGEHPYQ